MTERQFEDFLKQTLADLDPAPPAPREEMWARIEAQRQFRRQIKRDRNRFKTWGGFGIGLAAMLAIGIGLGRLSTTGVPTDRPATATATSTESSAPNRTAYRLVVQEHMTSAEALLTSFRTQPGGTLDPQVAVWARDLLTNTRLLLDSPAADDPKVAALLEDLELIIAQIASLSDTTKEEREIINDGMQKTAVLPRIRATQPAGPASAGT